MDWKHEWAFRQREGFVDYKLPSHFSSASCAVVMEAPLAGMDTQAGLARLGAGKIVADTFFNLGLTDDAGILFATCFRVPKAKNIGEGFFTTKHPYAKEAKRERLTQFGLTPMVRPTPLAPPSRLVMKTYCKKEFEGEIYHLVETLDYWALPVLAMGKVPQWALEHATYRTEGVDGPPFIVHAPSADAVLTSTKAHKKFEVIAEDFAEKVKKWRSANLKSSMAKAAPSLQSAKRPKRKK